MSKAKKYKVSVDGHFLGHYPAADATAAISKAVTANYKYHKDLIDNCSQFEVKRGMDPEQIVKREG